MVHALACILVLFNVGLQGEWNCIGPFFFFSFPFQTKSSTYRTRTDHFLLAWLDRMKVTFRASFCFCKKAKVHILLFPRTLHRRALIVFPMRKHPALSLLTKRQCLPIWFPFLHDSKFKALY